MDPFPASLDFSFGGAVGPGFGTVLVGATAFLLALGLYGAFALMKRRGGISTSVRFEMGAPAMTTPAPTPELSPEREEVLQTLDTVDGVVSRFYLVLLYFMMAAATALMALIYFKYPDDGQRQFMLFYGGVLYILGMLTLMAHVHRTQKRLRPRRNSRGRRASGPHSGFHITFEASPQMQFIDNAALDRAEQRLNAGAGIDDACAAVDPRYQNMNAVMQTIFRKAMETALEQRRQTPR